MREDHLIAKLRNLTAGANRRSVRVGIGDDAAVWQPSRSHRSVITTDALIEGVHFRTDWCSFHDIGVRAMAANVSDLAAMGARPVLATIALGIPSGFQESDVLDLYRGFFAVASDAKVAIAGGDITQAPVWTIAITAVGEVRPSNIKLRSGAKPGDILASTGALGASRAGLHVLRGELQIADAMVREEALRAYRTPAPRWREGMWLAASENVHALMDCSDGLSTDVARICEQSNAGVTIESVPLGAGAPDAEFALAGGEDYELLAAVAPRAFTYLAGRFQKQFGRPLLSIGTFTADPAQLVRYGGKEKPLVSSGYDHLENRPD